MQELSRAGGSSVAAVDQAFDERLDDVRAGVFEFVRDRWQTNSAEAVRVEQSVSS